MRNDTTLPTTYFGRLTLKSYLKISVFVGVTSGIIWAALYVVMVIVRELTGHRPPIDVDLIGVLRMLALTFCGNIIGSILSALIGFPLYLWICNRRGGHLITGFMKELNGQPGGSPYSSPAAGSESGDR